MRDLINIINEAENKDLTKSKKMTLSEYIQKQDIPEGRKMKLVEMSIDNTMEATVIIKATGEKYTARAEKKNGKWMIGGDYPDYKSCHYIIMSKGVEYTLRNGRLVRS